MPLTNSRTWRTRLGICDYSDGCSPRNGSTTKIHSIEWIVAKARFPSSLAFGRRPSIAVFKGPSVFSKREACYWSWYWVSLLCLLHKQRSSSVCMSLLCYLSTKKKKASSWTSRRILHRRKWDWLCAQAILNFPHSSKRPRTPNFRPSLGMILSKILTFLSLVPFCGRKDTGQICQSLLLTRKK